MKGLVLPAGGVRGYITTLYLEDFENRTGKQCYEVFDVIAGTSAGSILACGLGIGMPARELRQKYGNLVSDIFGRSNNISRLWSSKYDNNKLIDTLKTVFGEKQINETLTKVMVFTAQLDPVKTVVYKSWKTDDPIYLTCSKSSAAPTFFEPIDGEVDGGVWALDPGIETYSELIKLGGSNNRILTVGTGKIQEDVAAKSGILHWAKSIVDLLLPLQRMRTNYIMPKIMDNFQEIDIELPEDMSDMDDYENIPRMRNLVLDDVKQNYKEYQWIAEWMTMN